MEASDKYGLSMIFHVSISRVVKTIGSGNIENSYRALVRSKLREEVNFQAVHSEDLSVNIVSASWFA